MLKTFTMNTDRSTSRQSKFYDDGYLRVEFDGYFVSCGEELVKLSKIEFLIVSRLVQSPERVVTYMDLWKYVWGDHILNVETLKVHVYRLRRIFDPLGVKIETMVNVGYRFIPTTIN